MTENAKGLSWRWIGLLAAGCAAILAVRLYLALRPPSAAPAAGPYPDLVLKGKLTKRIPWEKLPVKVTWDGTKAGDIPKDLQAVYRGQTLYKLVGLVDDKDPKTFNVARARKGYGIKLISSDGYSWTMKSKAIIGQKNWIVARLKNGKAMAKNEGPYRDVGCFSRHFYGRESVKRLKRIQLVF
jgi:hypothetical protein